MKNDVYTIAEIMLAIDKGIEEFFKDMPIPNEQKGTTTMMKLWLTACIVDKLIGGEK